MDYFSLVSPLQYFYVRTVKKRLYFNDIHYYTVIFFPYIFIVKYKKSFEAVRIPLNKRITRFFLLNKSLAH